MFILKTKQSITVGCKGISVQVMQPVVFPPGTQKTSLDWVNRPRTASYSICPAGVQQPADNSALLDKHVDGYISGWRRVLYFTFHLLSDSERLIHAVLGVGWHKLRSCCDNSLMEAGLLWLLLLSFLINSVSVRRWVDGNVPPMAMCFCRRGGSIVQEHSFWPLCTCFCKYYV